jgi:diacylglycerol kinase family enzyme
VLVGNVGTVSGGLTAFTDARPDDGVLDVGVVRAKGRLEWARVFGRMVVGKGEGSPFVDVRQGKEITVRLERRTRVELDGGARDKVKRLAITIEPAALRVRLPVAATVGQGR